MKSSNLSETKSRMIHVRLPENLHKEVRIRAAETDVTIRGWVLDIMQRELVRQGKQAAEKG